MFVRGVCFWRRCGSCCVMDWRTTFWTVAVSTKTFAYHLRHSQSCIDCHLEQTFGFDSAPGSKRPHSQAGVLEVCLKWFVIEDFPYAGICGGQKSGYDAIRLLAHIGCFAEARSGNLRPGLGGAAASTCWSDSRAPGWPLRDLPKLEAPSHEVHGILRADTWCKDAG